MVIILFSYNWKVYRGEGRTKTRCYSLPWDQIGYWAVKIVTGVPEAIPIVKDWIVKRPKRARLAILYCNFYLLKRTKSCRIGLFLACTN